MMGQVTIKRKDYTTKDKYKGALEKSRLPAASYSLQVSEIELETLGFEHIRMGEKLF